MGNNLDRVPGVGTRLRRAIDSIGSVFVPYTGAWKDVDLGSFNLTTLGTITGEQITSTDDITMQGHLLTLGDGTATDIVISFSALANDGTLTYDESDNEFDFGSSLITTTGALGCGTITVTANGDVLLSGTGFVQAGSEGFIVGTLTITDGTIDDTDGAITFGDTNLDTSGVIAAGDLTVINYSENLFRGLLMHLPGDGNANDVSGQGNDGTLESGTYSNGIFGQAFLLNGAADYISLTSSAYGSIGTGDFTIMFWCYLDNTGVSDYTVFDTQTPRTIVRVRNTREMDMYINGTWRDPFNVNIPTEQWVHVAITRDSSGNLKGYYDGVLQNTIASITQAIGSSGTAALGSKHDGTGEYWDGSLDDFMIFNRAFDIKEIVAACKLGKPDGYFEKIEVGTMTLSGNDITDSTGTIDLNSTNLTGTGIITLNVQDVFETPFRDALLYLTGDGHANDSSGYGADATLGSTGFRTGVFGQAFEFNGTSDYVALDLAHIDVIDIDVGAFTMMGWAILDVDVGAANNYLFDTDGRWILGIRANTDLMNMFIDGTWRNPFNADFPIGRWVHFAITRDGSGNLKGYYDGVLKNTVAGVTNDIGNMSTTAALGSKHDGSFDWWEGACDEFMIFNRELGAEEVAAAHKLGRPDVLAEDMEISGDVVFRGSGTGLAYGEISCYNENDTITITGAGIANKAQITSFDTDGPSNNMTPDHTNDHITIIKAGHYLCTVSLHIESAGGGGADEFGFAVYKNGGTGLFENCHGHRKLAGGGGDIGAITISGILDLAIDDTIEVWCWNENSTDNLVVDDATLTLVQIGGT